MLKDTDKIVAHCMVMRLGEKEALSYLKTNGHEMSRITYYRIRKRLKSTKINVSQEITKTEFVTDQHLQNIQQLELIQQEMWKLYHIEIEPYKKAKILMKIVNVQPYLSSYYDASTMLLQ